MNQKQNRPGALMRVISRQIGRAIADYDMLHDGDKVMVAVSGGKDSLALLRLLTYRQTFAPIKFELLAVYVDCNIPGAPIEKLRQAVLETGVPFIVEKADQFSPRDWEEMNCFWCAWNRRKTLFRLAERLGFPKIALGHHMDDIVETILLNLFYRGEVGAMRPRQDLFEGRLTIIRPLAYSEEGMIRRFVVEELQETFVTCSCPRSSQTQRAAIKKLVAELQEKNPQVKKNIFHALKNIKTDYLLDHESA